MLPNDQVNALIETSRNTTSQWTETALEGQEKLLRANIDVLQDLIKMGGEQFRDGSADLTAVLPLGSWPKVVMNNIQRGTSLNLGLLSMARRMQQEMGCVIEQNLRALRDGSLEAVDRYASVASSEPKEELRRAA